MTTSTWAILLAVAACGWLLMWIFTKPKGGKDDNQD